MRKKSRKIVFVVSCLMLVLFQTSWVEGQSEAVMFYYGDRQGEKIEIPRCGSSFSPPRGWPNNVNWSDRAIIGRDERVRVNPSEPPYSGVLLLKMLFDFDGDGNKDDETYATGAMVSSDVMVTCAHALYWYEKGVTAYQMRVISGQDGDFIGGSYCLPLSWILPSEYIQTGSSNYDWCVVKLQAPIGNRTGWFGYGVDPMISGKNISVSGYPGDKQFYQYMARGKMNTSTAFRFSHSADTTSGQSGAPVYDDNGVIWGIHTSSDPLMNYGCSITQRVYDAIEQMKKAAGISYKHPIGR